MAGGRQPGTRFRKITETDGSTVVLECRHNAFSDKPVGAVIFCPACTMAAKAELANPQPVVAVKQVAAERPTPPAKKPVAQAKTRAPRAKAPKPSVASAASVLARLLHGRCIETGMAFQHEAVDHEAGILAAFKGASKSDLQALAALAGVALEQ